MGGDFQQYRANVACGRSDCAYTNNLGKFCDIYFFFKYNLFCFLYAYTLFLLLCLIYLLLSIPFLLYQKKGERIIKINCTTKYKNANIISVSKS